MHFAVGLKLKGKVNHVLVDAEDALIAALKAQTKQAMCQPPSDLLRAGVALVVLSQGVAR